MALKEDLVREELELVADALMKAGGHLRLVFPPEVLARQSTWPEAAPLPEAEMRRKLEDARKAARNLGEEARDLVADHPEPVELEKLGDSPDHSVDDALPSVYRELIGAFAYLCEEAAPQIERVVGEALTATPESLRDQWLRRHVPEHVRRIFPRSDPQGEK